MLVLNRSVGQWVDVAHNKSGDIMRIRVCRVRPGFQPRVDLAFEDDARNFDIQRPERKPRAESVPQPDPQVDEQVEVEVEA
ncbi:MAG: hypothetical protein SFX72_20300 [Isosphaeraceae bacterium]|nr:hypothetical protein [Isosphaeraceae bacterium]